MKKIGIDGVGTEGSLHITKADANMSVAHMKDSLEYNLRHAEEHLKHAKTVCERLRKAGEPLNIPKSTLDLFDYFEGETDKSNADSKLKKHIQGNY